MKKTLLFVLTLAGLSAVSAKTLQKFYYVNKTLPWHEAQKYCKQMYHDLAPIKSHTINSMVQHLIQGAEEPVWIGLYDDTRIWQWSFDHQVHHTMSTAFQNWEDDQPDNKHSSESCTLITADGDWDDVSCMKQLPAVCSKQTGPVKFTVVETPMSWLEARKYCKSKYKDLASILNEQNQNQIESILTEDSWIGLRRIPWYYWPSGMRITFTNWHPGQPDDEGSCVVINATTGTWWDAPCEEEYSFICHQLVVVPDAVSARYKIRFQSKADLKDAALQRQVVKQLHAKLEEHGLPHYKLRWLHTEEQTYNWEQEKKEEWSGA